MADTTTTVTVTDKWHDGKRQFMIGTIAVGAGPLTYPANGVPLDLRAAGFRGTQKPYFMVVDGIAGYIFVYDRVNGTLRAFQGKDPAAAGGADLPLQEIATGAAIPAGLSGDTIRFLAIGQISG